MIKNAEAKNPNLNDINFSLVNTTNHLIIDLTLSREAQDLMQGEGAGNGTGEGEGDNGEGGDGGGKGPPFWTYEQKRKPKFDANQQAVMCMLQDISYICIGKGKRKCCDIDAVGD